MRAAPASQLRVARPGELGGAETERPHHRLQPLLDEAAHAGIGTDAGQNDQLAAGPQHAGEFVKRDLRSSARRSRHIAPSRRRRIVREFELLGVHDSETLDVLQAEFVDALPRLLQHQLRNIGAEDPQVRRVERQ